VMRDDMTSAMPPPGGPLLTVMDVDTGIDDALALLLALRSPEIRLVGVTCVAGNVTLGQVVRNTLGVLAVAGAGEVPVAAGAARPLVRRLTTATFFHGADGIGGVALPSAEARPLDEPAAAYLCRLARAHAGRLNLVAVGPLTNVALACRLDPGFAGRLQRLVVMGGAAAVAGNVTPAAEANFYNDPEAARIVFESGADLTMVGLDVTLRALFEARRHHLLGPAVAARADRVAQFAYRVMERYLQADLAAGLEGSPLHDPLAVAALARPELVTCRPLRVEIETEGRLTAGQSVANVAGVVERLESRGDHDDVAGLARPEPNCRVALDVDAAGFVDLFCARLGLVADVSQKSAV
jgi:inosine-uridine nucleoside N-ribohydrolase